MIIMVRDGRQLYMNEKVFNYIACLEQENYELQQKLDRPKMIKRLKRKIKRGTME